MPEIKQTKLKSEKYMGKTIRFTRAQRRVNGKYKKPVVIAQLSTSNVVIGGGSTKEVAFRKAKAIIRRRSRRR